MKTYNTSRVASIIGVHPNTVRLYEKIGFISAAKRLPNGYRVYNEIHISQMKLARTAMRAEILQNGLRKKAVDIIRLCAASDIKSAIEQTNQYLIMIDEEILRASDAAVSVEKIIRNDSQTGHMLFTRQQAAAHLDITPETLRNWERNGLIKIKRKNNGYRVYNSSDMTKLSIIRTLRCANYSLSSILRLMNRLSSDNYISVSDILNTTPPDEEIISVCDKLLVSLTQTKSDAFSILEQLEEIKKIKPYT